MGRAQWLDREGWEVRPLPTAARGGRRVAGEATFPAQFLQSDAVRIGEAFEVTPRPDTARRRAAELPRVDLAVELAPDEACLLAIRHPSGALTFHRPAEPCERQRSVLLGVFFPSRDVSSSSQAKPA